MRVPEIGGRIAAKVAKTRAGVVLPDLSYAPSPNQSDRRGHPVTLVVVHDTEGSYAGSTSWLRNPKVEASAHLILREDGKVAVQLVPWARKAWHAAEFNSASIGLEMAGVASHGFGSDELKRAARVVAFLLHKYGLPPTHVKPGRDGVTIGRGFTFHQDLGAAGGGHHDPGFSPAKAAAFSALVAYEYHRGGFRPVWGLDNDPL